MLYFSMLYLDNKICLYIRWNYYDTINLSQSHLYSFFPVTQHSEESVENIKYQNDASIFSIYQIIINQKWRRQNSKCLRTFKTKPVFRLFPVLDCEVTVTP